MLSPAKPRAGPEGSTRYRGQELETKLDARLRERPSTTHGAGPDPRPPLRRGHHPAPHPAARVRGAPRDSYSALRGVRQAGGIIRSLSIINVLRIIPCYLYITL